MQYLCLGQHRYSIPDVCRMLGIQVKEGDTISVRLEREVENGILRAVTAAKISDGPDEEPYPNIETELVIPDEGTPPLFLVRTEEDQPNGNVVKTFIYGRGESYIACVPHDIRPESELPDEDLHETLIVAGDFGETVDVYRENAHTVCHPIGELPEGVSINPA